MFTQKRDNIPLNSFVCPDCGSTRCRITGKTITCTNCDYVLQGGTTNNKYGAKRTTANDGMKRDSKFEAATADDLLLRKQAGDIKDYDSQFKIEAIAYRKDGRPAFVVKHKVDFRIHHRDGSYELLEAKGAETDDYKWRRKFLEHIWLPEHPDHIYTVVKQSQRRI